MKKRVPEYVATREGTILYNPRVDAFALRLGATYVSPNRYQLGSLMLSRDGAALATDRETCAECHSGPGVDNRFFVRTESQNPFAKPWEKAWTYCHTCVTPAELEDLKRKALAAAPVDMRRKQVH